MSAVKSFLSRFIAGSGANQLGVHAAALAYYAVFSVFPLSLLIISGLGFLLPEHSFQAALDALTMLFPHVADLVAVQAARIQAARNAVGLIGLVGLLYGASGYFSGLSVALHQVIDGDPKRPVWLHRGLGILLVTLVGVLLLVSVFLLFLAGSLAQLPIVPEVVAGLLRTRASSAIVFAAGSLAMFLLFHFIPRRRPPVRPALIGALATMLGLAILSTGFNWYLNSPLARFSVIYGSIGTVIALILFLNLANMVIVHGALLTSLLSQPDR